METASPRWLTLTGPVLAEVNGVIHRARATGHTCTHPFGPALLVELEGGGLMWVQARHIQPNPTQ
ncbi:MAG: hypothetical protein QF848_15325 [Planctomycetota bacterium]|jgi:hypothetical protein|nr:hypothetical protein [Planctomycetota bacterium]